MDFYKDATTLKNKLDTPEMRLKAFESKMSPLNFTPIRLVKNKAGQSFGLPYLGKDLPNYTESVSKYGKTAVDNYNFAAQMIEENRGKPALPTPTPAPKDKKEESIKGPAFQPAGSAQVPIKQALPDDFRPLNAINDRINSTQARIDTLGANARGNYADILAGANNFTPTNAVGGQALLSTIFGASKGMQDADLHNMTNTAHVGTAALPNILQGWKQATDQSEQSKLLNFKEELPSTISRIGLENAQAQHQLAAKSGLENQHIKDKLWVDEYKKLNPELQSQAMFPSLVKDGKIDFAGISKMMESGDPEMTTLARMVLEQQLKAQNTKNTQRKGNK